MARKVFPKNVHFLLADLVRQEAGGKLSILGVYAGGDLILQGELPTELPPEMNGLALPSLTILAFITDGHGSFKVEYSLTSPDGVATRQTPQDHDFEKTKDRAATMIVRFEPFPIRDFGKYLFTCSLDDHKYSFEFFVKHQDPQARLPAAVAPSKPSDPKKRERSRAVRTKTSASLKGSGRQPRPK